MKKGFPIGYYKVHPLKILDYQLNRWHSLGFFGLNDIRLLGANINGMEDWKDQMWRVAQEKTKEGKRFEASMYFRGAEFFTFQNDPDKLKLYRKFKSLFYESQDKQDLHIVQVPYKNAFLPTLQFKTTVPKVDTVLLFGGFDSFMEEFYYMSKALADKGIEVICFEGPGQGEPLKQHNLKMILDWEKPTKAILDFFNINKASLLGISMGGWWAIRAAAFEPRITKVIALGVVYDYLEILPPYGKKLLLFLMRQRNLMNQLAKIKMKLIPQERWSINNLMYLTGEETPMDASEIILQMNKRNINSERVMQDVLLLSGVNDHFIPIKMHQLQVNALTNAKSVTDHVFTAAQSADNHCMVGNIGLAVETIAHWIHKKSKHT